MKQYELAQQLGITPGMVSRLVKKGMPTDSLERAQRWRKRHLEPGRIKGARFVLNAKPAVKPAPAHAPQDPDLQILEDDWDDAELLRLHGMVDELDQETAFRVLDRLDEAIARHGRELGRLLDAGRPVEPERVKYMRALLRAFYATDPNAPVLPLSLWLLLVDHALAMASPLRSMDVRGMVCNPGQFGQLVRPESGLHIGWLNDARDDPSTMNLSDELDAED